ncbi:MAG: prepilin-type N-terminal cleavage/methylation domain-containing protein, partial [Candidatus Riflebacteria bacterium]
MHDNRSGFTLMEIMVVVVIIAVLASVAGPMIGDIINQGKASATRSKMSSLKSAIVTYKNDVGRYPFYGDKDKVS